MTRTPAELRAAARQLEHGVEYNEDRMHGWDSREKALNTRLINRVRELVARADQIEDDERVARELCGACPLTYGEHDGTEVHRFVRTNRYREG